ncbi:MAG: cell division protein FtsQ/DivIB [Burkholderiaceae bacterium]|jgi:cell division protein FtsQ|nr:cell division protein FtsQ/DivIB [Burkholderiaceae bacterium]
MWHNARLLNGISKGILLLFLLIVLMGCFLWYAQRPLFALDTLYIREESGKTLRHVDKQVIRDKALPLIKGSFFTVELESVRSAFKTIPWIRDVSVRRKWPNGLIVLVEEHKPLGTWGKQGELLSVKGDVFIVNRAEAEEDARLLSFSGPKGSEKEVTARYMDLKQWFSPIGLKPFVLELSERYAWKLKLDNGMTVKLGRERESNRMQEQVARFLAAYPRLTARFGRIDNVDLRYPNGLALRGAAAETQRSGG